MRTGAARALAQILCPRGSTSRRVKSSPRRKTGKVPAQSSSSPACRVFAIHQKSGHQIPTQKANPWTPGLAKNEIAIRLLNPRGCPRSSPTRRRNYVRGHLLRRSARLGPPDRPCRRDTGSLRRRPRYLSNSDTLAPRLINAALRPLRRHLRLAGGSYVAQAAHRRRILREALWNAVAAVATSPRLKVVFFVARAMQGLAAGVPVSASMSILGRVYSPGVRNTRVFSLMAAGSPFSYWLGCLLAGALSSHLPCIFGSSAILMSVLTVAAQLVIPPVRPASNSINSEAPSLCHFDYVGAGLASLGCTLIIFGLTQGDSADWNPYTYSSIIVGFLMLGVFYYVEKRITRPLIPNRLWQTPGFGPLLISYFLGLGAYSKCSHFTHLLHKESGQAKDRYEMSSKQAY